MRRLEELDILEAAIGLKVGHTTRGVECPFCPPTDKEKGSLAITRDEVGILYKCHRAKCTGSGFIPTTTFDYTPKKKQKVHTFSRPLSKLPTRIKNILHQKYGITPEEQSAQEFKYDFQEERVYMPIFNYNGWDIGGVSRAIDTTADLKAISYFNDESSVRMHFPKGIEKHKSNYVVIVEDILSAVRVNKYVPCVALLGTTLNDEKVHDLLLHWRNVILALDADTWHHETPLGIKYYNRYNLAFNEFIPVYIEKDFKNMSEEELVDKLHEIFPETFDKLLEF